MIGYQLLDMEDCEADKAGVAGAACCLGQWWPSVVRDSESCTKDHHVCSMWPV